MALIHAIRHLYPNAIENGQIRLRDDGEGAYIEYFDPSLGEEPTQAELDQAELDYRLPSYLKGGTRHPDAQEVAQDLETAYDYFYEQMQIKASNVALRHGFYQSTRDSSGRYVKIGQMEKAAKYANLLTGPFRVLALELVNWENEAWAYLRTRWQAIDPNGDFSGGGATPPTWAELETSIDLAHPEP